MPSLVFFCAGERAKGLYVPRHEHSCWEIVWYRNGAGTTRINGTPFSFGKDSFAVLPPHTPHDERHKSDGRLAFLGFSETSLSLRAGVYRDGQQKPVGHTVERILWEAQNRFDDGQEMIELLLRELILLLHRLESPVASNADGIGYAKKFIEENYNWKICFPELAASCGYGFDQFRRKFKETYGISPKNYLVELRLERAYRLLQSTDMSCTDVAYECGFSDSAQFSTMYRNHYGVSPRHRVKKD